MPAAGCRWLSKGSRSPCRALIGRNLIGTNLQSSDFTRDDLAVGLRSETYWENGLDLGAESLPIPAPLEAIESLDPIAP